MFSGPIIAFLSGDFFDTAFSSAQSHTPSEGPVGVRWSTRMWWNILILLIGGEEFPGGDVLALHLGYPGADLLVHLPPLLVLHSLCSGGVLCVALPPGASLGLLV